MASLRDIRKRIRSTKNTRQITKAMKMVSAAKLRRAQEGVIAARPYAQTLDQVMSQLITKAEGSMSHPLLTRREVKKAELVVMTSDRGLAGGFNANITRRALRYLTENKETVQVSVTTLGRKGGEFLRGRGVAIRKDYPGVFGRMSFATADAIGKELAARFLTGEVDAVYLMYNEFASAVTQVPTTAQLLPFEAKKEEAKGGSKSLVDYEYEPEPAGVLEALVPRAVSMKVYRAMLESVAAEHAARMTAMENATRNAGDMISGLTLFYNRSRQAQITKELVEIVSGAEALKG